MEMEIKNSKYWYLEDNKNKKKWIFNTEKDAVDKLKDLIKKKTPTDTLNLQVMECGSDKLELRPVPWQEIITSLIE